jgi:adenine phosphoribosyltransferase
MNAAEIKALVRTVPDFPAPGIQFRDITTLIAHPAGFAATLDHLTDAARGHAAAAVAGIEARGFLFGAAIAARLGLGFVPLRKPGKLPVETIGVDYALEYGQARLELDPALIRSDEPMLLVDDLLATRGHRPGRREPAADRGSASRAGAVRDRPAGARRIGKTARRRP